MSYTKRDLTQALSEIGIKQGDTLLIHTDIRGFRLPDGMQTKEQILSFYTESIREVIGEKGTLAVPAYYYEYARFGTPFDVDHSPVSDSLGAFSQWIANHPERTRSLNPLQSIAAIGPNAEALTGKSLSGYGPLSPWQKLRELKGKIVFLGAPLQSMTFVHHIEQQQGVPHLYVKIYPYPVIQNGRELHEKPTSAVRYLDYQITYLLDRYEQDLKQAGALLESKISGVSVQAVEAEEAFQIGLKGLEVSPYYFLKAPPQFIPGKIPLDGLTGASK